MRDAALRATRLAPVIRLRDNTYVPYVPTRPRQRTRLFWPMILLSTDIFYAGEPLADGVLDDWEDNTTTSTSLGLHVHGWVDDEYWFSRGGMVFQPNLHNPVLVYLRRHEIPASRCNLYNGFTSCYYPPVNIFTEELRHWRVPSGPC